jgi:2-polyprenyl-6-methoxyphenol hydroxylase-like FAD-dependent oxidoreductase
VLVQFAGGRVERADILIGGDGIHSSISCAGWRIVLIN